MTFVEILTLEELRLAANPDPFFTNLAASAILYMILIDTFITI
jgi:hypothetical protein